MSLFPLIILTVQAASASNPCYKLSQSFQEIENPEGLASYNEVLAIMQRGIYDPKKLPLIPLTMWKFIGKQLSFFVGMRSKAILNEKRDFREIGMEKPVHPMGIGLIGIMKMHPTRWSGVFAGGEFPVLARASISQGNPYESKPDGEVQNRSTAMAIKVFPTKDSNERRKTANAVFQNDLNGLPADDGSPLRILDSEQTNQPNLNLSKIRYSYEVLTLIGVFFGSITTPRDRIAKLPFVNPQIRPVHSWAEMGVTKAEDIRLPTWVKIRPKLEKAPVPESDFRLEIAETLKRDGKIIYEVFAANVRDDRGIIQWELVGEIIFNEFILSEGVDRNLLFPHDNLNSRRSSIPFALPVPRKQYRTPAEDIQ